MWFLIVLGWILAGAALCFLFPLAHVHGDSMEPTMHAGEVYLCRRLFVFPWTRIEHFSHKINRVYVVAPEQLNDPTHVRHVKRLRKVMPEGLWFEGDNKRVSYDSRHYGPVSPKRLVAVVIRRVFG